MLVYVGASLSERRYNTGRDRKREREGRIGRVRGGIERRKEKLRKETSCG